MAVDPPRKWPDFLALPDLPATRFVLHTGPGLSALRAGGSGGFAVAVGPEGGFAPEEVSEALAKGWTAASLGPRVLRMETAAIAAAALLATS
jgi:16S rRNA (uracil1498-N3)-methyltransferase